MAGRIAEEIFCGDIDSGASADIAGATDVARKMILEWGMSDKLSFVRYSPSQVHQAMLDLSGKEYSERTAETIDDEIKRIMDRAYQDTKVLIESNRDKIKALAEALMKYETLDVGEVDQILRGEKLDKPNMNDLLDRERAKPVTPVRPSGRPGVEHSPNAGTGVPEAGSI
jgi:cell division protease FtsH